MPHKLTDCLSVALDLWQYATDNKTGVGHFPLGHSPNEQVSPSVKAKI